MLTELQKRTIQAMVNVFETGKPAGDYSCVTLLPGDPGRLTYGRSQATLASGNLWRLLQGYCASASGAPAEGLRAYLARLEACDTSLDADAHLRVLLSEAGSDPVMRSIQDEFFDRTYWDPASLAAHMLGIETALGTGVVYDSFIHGAWARLRNATNAQVGVAPMGASTRERASERDPSERRWIGAYITVRRDWLAGHANPLLRRTVYRMDTFATLVAAGNWDLVLPIEAHGVRIDQHLLGVSEVAHAVDS
jgi:chitosanase